MPENPYRNRGGIKCSTSLRDQEKGSVVVARFSQGAFNDQPLMLLRSTEIVSDHVQPGLF